MLFLFTINLPKKKISSKHYLQSLLFKKKLSFDQKKNHVIKENYLNYKHLISIKTIHFNLKKETIFDYFFCFFCYFPDVRFSKNIFAFNLTFSLVGRER